MVNPMEQPHAARGTSVIQQMK
jgi:hypothetical protein